MYLKYQVRPVRQSGILCWFLFLLSFSVPSLAVTQPASSPQPGTYCPGIDIKLIIAEELTASLDLAMRSRTAMLDKDQMTAASAMDALATTLNLASSRGAGARTAELIDAIIRSSSGDNFKQMLEWLPLLYTSLQPLQGDAAGRTAKQIVEQAEGIMAGEKDGHVIQLLKQSKHLLTCDGLSIPIEQARQQQFILASRLKRGQVTKASDYNALLDSIRSALQYTLSNP